MKLVIQSVGRLTLANNTNFPTDNVNWTGAAVRPTAIRFSPSTSTMSETSTKRLVEDIDTATRNAYHALRTALHKLEDLKMKIIRKPEANLFGPEHDEMYKMYLDLSKRFQEMREEVHGRTNLVQSQPPTPEPAPRVEEPPATEPSPSIKRNKSRPYVLVPVSFLFIVKD